MEIIVKEKHFPWSARDKSFDCVSDNSCIGKIAWGNYNISWAFFCCGSNYQENRNFLFKCNYLSCGGSCGCLIIDSASSLWPQRSSMLSDGDLIPSMCDVIQHDIQVCPLDHRMALSVVCLQKRTGSLVPSTFLQGINRSALVFQMDLGFALRQQEHHYRTALQVVRQVEKCEWMSLRGRNACHGLFFFWGGGVYQIYMQYTIAKSRKEHWSAAQERVVTVISQGTEVC